MYKYGSIAIEPYLRRDEVMNTSHTRCWGVARILTQNAADRGLWYSIRVRICVFFRGGKVTRLAQFGRAQDF